MSSVVTDVGPSTMTDVDPMSSPLLRLPSELRLAIYRSLLVESPGPVLVELAILHGYRYLTSRDLRVLETNRQIRKEALDVFYHESLFVVQLHIVMAQTRVLHGFVPIDMTRVRKCHMLYPRSHPRLWFDLNQLSRTQWQFKILARTLNSAPTQRMQYQLIECAYFEICTLNGKRRTRTIRSVTEPLEAVRGVKLVHIRALSQGIWPYMRCLENLMMSSKSMTWTLEEGSCFTRGLLPDTCNATGDSESQLENSRALGGNPEQMFSLLGVKPVYEDLSFRDAFLIARETADHKL